MSKYTNSVKLTGSTESSDTVTGALVVTGGVGVGGAINCNSGIKSDGLVISKGNYDFFSYSPGYGESPVLATFGAQLSLSGCLAYDGTCWWSSFLSGGMYKFDPLTNDTTTYSMSTGNDNHGFYSYNNYIYSGSISGGNSLGRIDVDLGVQTILYSGLSKGLSTPARYKNKLYWSDPTPSSANFVFSVFDLDTEVLDQTSLVVTTASTARKSEGCSLAPNGKIYAVPRDWSTIVILDPETDVLDSTTFASISGMVSPRFIFTPNGYGYTSGGNTNAVWRLDYVNDTITTIATPGTGFGGFRLAQDGYLYAVKLLTNPYGLMMRYDTSNDSFDLITLANCYATSQQDQIIAHPNGKLYIRDRNGKVISLPTLFPVLPANSVCNPNINTG